MFKNHLRGRFQFIGRMHDEGHVIAFVDGKRIVLLQLGNHVEHRHRVNDFYLELRFLIIELACIGGGAIVRSKYLQILFFIYRYSTWEKTRKTDTSIVLLFFLKHQRENSALARVDCTKRLGSFSLREST